MTKAEKTSIKIIATEPQKAAVVRTPAPVRLVRNDTHYSVITTKSVVGRLGRTFPAPAEKVTDRFGRTMTNVPAVAIKQEEKSAGFMRKFREWRSFLHT